MPSLHAGFTMLVALNIWTAMPWRWARPLLLLYPAAMALTLMATGEHYFFDIAARLALRGHGDARLGRLGTAPRPPGSRRSRSPSRPPARAETCIAFL